MLEHLDVSPAPRGRGSRVGSEHGRTGAWLSAHGPALPAQTSSQGEFHAYRPAAAPKAPPLVPNVSAQAPRYVRNVGYAWATHTAPQPPRRAPGASQSIILAMPETSDSGRVPAPDGPPLWSA